MSFLEIQFPADISYGATGGPTYSTDVVSMFSGHEQRNINWKHARGKYNIATGIKTEEQLQELINFFRSCKGRAYGFRFKDWSDYKVRGQEICFGDGIKKELQLIKTYSCDSVIVIREIKKPVEDSIKVYLKGNLRANLDYSVDYTRGIVTFVDAPVLGSVIMADFEFDVPVRFDTDELQLSLNNFGVGSWNSIPLVEIRL